MVLDVEAGDLPEFGRIWVYGVLEFEWEGGLDLKLSATHIFISGGRLIVGWEVRIKSSVQKLSLELYLYMCHVTTQWRK